MMHYIPTLPGDWLLAAAGRSALFVQVGPDFPRPGAAGDAVTANPVEGLAAALLDALAAGDPIQSTLELLTAGGLGATPAFALVTRREADSVHLLVRGSAFANAVTTAGTEEANGTGVSTWRETTISNVTSLDLGTTAATAGDADAADARVAADATRNADVAGAGSDSPRAALRLPLQTGVAWAAGVRIVFSDVAPDATATALQSLGGDDTAAVTSAQAAPAVPAPAEATPSPTPTVAVVTAVVPIAEPIVGDAPVPEPEVEPQAEPEADDAYGHLFEETIVRTMEEAAVRPVAVDDDDAPAPTAAGEPGTSDSDALSSAVENTGQYIDESDIAEEEPTNAASPFVSTEVGSGDSPFGIPAFDAPSPTSSQTAVQPVARAFYLEVSTGGREPLTAPILVGRAPSVSKVPSGLVPRLITIPGDQDISRNHVRVALEGDTVVVTDLDSRNGTAVILPGKPSQKLRRSEPTAVLVNTVIDLGGGVTLTVREEK